MQRTEVYSPFRSKKYNPLFFLTMFSSVKKTSLFSSKPPVKNDLSYSFFQESSYFEELSEEEAHSQARQCLSLIKDPLWQEICREVAHMMGPCGVLKMWDSTLGPLSSHHQRVDLYCQTEEIARFVRQYAFVILASLQRYFPAVKSVKVKVR